MKRYSINGCVEMNATSFYMLMSFPVTISFVFTFLFLNAFLNFVWQIELLKVMPTRRVHIL
jgi:hypothetical protein